MADLSPPKAMKVKNDPFSLNSCIPKMCDMCLTSDVHKLSNLEFENNQLRERIAELESVLSTYMKKDSAMKAIQKNFKHYDSKQTLIKQVEQLEHISNQFEYDISNSPTCYMVTITYDPKKFPVLNNRGTQRLYILYTLDQLYRKHTFIQGCYELHKNGVVHAHFITFDPVPKDIISSYFTNNKLNDKCIHVCQKTYEEAYLYITKEATKDGDNRYNFFQKID